MRVLLDTHAWLWMLMAPERFSPRALEIVASSSHRLVLSAGSAWEIGIKHRLGRLELPGPPEAVIPDLMLRSDVEGLAVTHTHALRAAALPLHHRDPFDRLLVAQAQVEGLPILSADPALAAYVVEILPAE